MAPLVPEVYGVFGHGCDILNGESSENIPMPPDIVYVTIAICGLVSMDLLKLMYAFEDKNIWPALRDPLRHKETLQKYFEDSVLKETHLQIHSHGDDYVDCMNTLFYNGNNNIFKSGLYRLGEFQPANPDIDYANPEIGNMRVAKVGPYSEADIRAIYKGSRIQPTHYGPFRTTDDFKAVNKLDVQLSKMFQQVRETDPSQTFVFYNFACRTVCGPFDRNVQGRSLARRAKNLPADMLRDRLYIMSVDSQVASVDAVVASRVPQIDFREWVIRRRVKGKETRRNSRQLRKKRVRSRLSAFRSKGTKSWALTSRATNSATRRLKPIYENSAMNTT
jgi:hypothetical protein